MGTQHKSTDHSTKVTNKGYRTLFDNAHVIMLLIDPHSLDIVDANHAACNFYGWKLEDFTDKKISHLNSLPENEVSSFVQKAINEVQNHFFFKHRIASGEIRDVEVNTFPTKSGDKNLLCSIIRDVTERNKIEEKYEKKLQNSEEQYWSLFTEIPISTMIHDKDSGEIIDANPAAYTSLGYSSFEELNANGVWYEPPYSLADAQKLIHKALSEGPQEFEWLHKKKDGDFVWLYIRLSPVIINGVQRVMSAAINITEHKNAEIALKNSDRQLHAFIDTIPYIIWLKDLNGVFITCNTKMELLFNARIQDIIGKTDYDFHAKELADFFRQKDIEALEADRPLVNEEIVTFAADGHTEYLETIKTPMYDSSGTLVGVLGVGRDISERKLAEKELSEERERLENIIVGTNVGTWEWNVQTDKTSFNERWAEIVGYTLDELEPLDFQTWKELVHPEDIEKAELILKKHFEGELDHYECEIRMLHKNREWVWVHARGKVIKWNDDGNPLLMYGTHTDITEKKRAETKFAEEATRRRILVEQSNDGIVVINDKGKVIEANHKYADMLGYSMDELLKLHVWDWDDQSKPEELRKRAKNAKGTGITFVTKHRRKDGNLLDMEVSSNAAIIGGEKLIFCVCRDITERKKAEEKLKQTEQKYKRAYKLMQEVIESPKDIVIFALDKEYRYIAFNKNHQMTMKNIWGADIEIDACMLDYIKDSADVEKAKHNFDRVLAGEAFTLVEEYGDSLLERKWYENTYSPLEDDEGAVIGLTLLLTDITERKMSEMELLRKDIQLRTAQNVGNVGSWEIDLTSHLLDASEEARKIYGIEGNKEYTNEYIRNLALPEYHQMLSDSMSNLITKGIRYDVEFKIRRVNDGEIRYIHSAAEYFAERNVIIGVIQDITERKEAERRIVEEVMRRRLLIENSSDGIVIINQNGKILEANKKYAEMTGYSPDEVSAMYVWELDAKWTQEEMSLHFKNFKERPRYIETTIRRKDGTFIDVEISSSMATLNGETQIFSVCRDITERKETEVALLRAKALAEESNQIKSDFIANMSHELRTPLNSVIGFSQVLNDKIFGDLNEKQSHYVSNILKSGNHLLKLINDILDVSKIESGNMKYEPEIMNMSEVLEESITLMEPLIKDKYIDFKTDIKLDDLKVNADKTKIKQILYNLLSNAIKFTPKYGKLRVESKVVNGKIQTLVSDNGIGIAMEEQKTIFSPFKQVSSSANRTHGGTGLGLAIVKYYVEMHSGDISVESDVGKGSTFTFTIPIDSENN
ncbi:PAS domain S-box protein [Methanolobus sediminis]|uniref:histidine kinase n=1 Tax=Methanolobus sediminis TaxID=3072978 RepID=A0AA51YLH8_9EURY|nr:PAS domain S-box protein [Methanolobus sediminis]WMW24942.1 PAS domain S-box protein [Methanolobus sediminis]